VDGFEIDGLYIEIFLSINKADRIKLDIVIES
jgi:hypothetical protein